MARLLGKELLGLLRLLLKLELLQLAVLLMMLLRWQLLVLGSLLRTGRRRHGAVSCDAWHVGAWKWRTVLLLLLLEPLL